MPILTKSHSEDAPSGENLEYEKVFTDLLLAAQFEEERQMGDQVLEAQEPDPKAIISQAEAVLEQSNDLRAAILYGYAKTRTDGFPGLAEATAFLRSCLEEYWDTCHPQLDEDDDDDPTMRVNSVLGLVDKQTILRAVRTAPLTQSQAFGRISLRDVSIANGETTTPEGMENPPSAQSISAAFQDTSDEIIETIMAAVQSASADVAAINAIFDEKIPGQGPNLTELAAQLKKAMTVLAPYAAADLGEADETSVAQGEGETPSAATAAPAAPPGTITSRADVEKALGKIIEYYAKHEPSSPLPLLLTRAQRLIGADFMTIVQDLAPLGIENVQLIGGMENPE